MLFESFFQHITYFITFATLILETMKKIYRLLLLALCFCHNSFSQEQHSNLDRMNMVNAFVQQNISTRAIISEQIEEQHFTIYNLQQEGFVITSNSKNLPPILAYSNKSSFPAFQQLPENIASWMQQYGEMSVYADLHPERTPDFVKQQWSDFEDGLLVFSKKGVSHLLSTTWNQDCYYNEYCPNDRYGPCGHTYAGCVACAMSQIMKYHNHPQHGFGSHSYSLGSYGTLSANFGETTYDWNNMPNSIHQHNDAVATLMYHCGVSVNMNYKPDGSGAQSKDVETALRNYFGYCGATYKERSRYSDQEWYDIVRNELDNGRPLYYSGSSGSSGHAFVCEGYNDSDYFYFNWGWSGYSDGYFSLYDVNGWSGSQTVVVNIRPMVINCDENGIIYVSPDGEGDGSSWENATSQLHFANARSYDGIRIWAKKGVYYGNDDDPENAFNISYSDRVFGSFNGDEASDYDLSQRDFVNNASILDGRNAKRVLNQPMAFTAGTAAIWDGFTIQNGNAGTGAGIYLNDYITIANCNIRNNNAEIYGGGIYINAASNNKKVVIDHCTISHNSTSLGAGICDRYGTVFSNCIICNNTASTKGGGLYIYNNAEPTLKGCIISNNTAKNGAGMYARGKMTVTNCNFVMNDALESSGGIFSENRYSRYTNCIVWGNKADGTDNQIDGEMKADYCAVQGNYEGENMIVLSAENNGETPENFVRFIQPAEGAGAEYHDADWSLMPRSICLNAGKPNTTGLGANDLFGNFRIQNGRIEIGAYESCSPLNVIDHTTCGSTYNFNGTILTEPGYYTTAYETAFCDSIVGLNLTFNPSSMEVTISGSTQINFGESTTLTASGADSYLWSTGETTTSITVSPTQTTTYTVTGYNNDGCEAQAVITVEVKFSDVAENSVDAKVYPNPTKGNITIEANGMQHVTISNILGQTIYDVTSNSDSMTLDLTQFGNGIFIVRISNNNGTCVRRISVE